ncbi:threonine aspartase 1-like isoform X1 [Limulus polyphemus]|uniref:Threonine aspartase 1-like isoform X1 n=2 Tax=Limulus polyphemus TaxID=6850 RepID=A0ABM1T6N2_LIMPO|nr:threonine aspartase 1-like isoform X1 [Limulus polyphemus]
MNEGFIALHVGAGHHSMEKKHAYKTLCKKSCQKVTIMLKDGCSAVEAVSAAVVSLENSLLTNAGRGSNLSLSRKVECDASIMDGRTLNFGAVGALSDYMNPVLVAKELLLHQNNENLSLHRISPCVLVGEGASQWARSRGLKSIKSDLLVSENALHTYNKYKRKVEEAENDPRKFLQREPANNETLHSEAKEMEKNPCISSEAWFPGDESLKLDTVGAVGMDCCGNVASAVSSGGIVLKHPGRLGQAALYGCGSWAQNSLSSTEPAVAVTTSGNGEHLIKTMFARTCAETLISNTDGVTGLHYVFHTKFLESPFLIHTSEKLAGVLAMKFDPVSNSVEVLWAHNTATMVLGYMSTHVTKAVTMFSTLPSSVDPGHKPLIQGSLLKLHNKIT